MLRVIVKAWSAAPYGEWPVTTERKTFDIEGPEVEAFIRRWKEYNIPYGDAVIDGVEILEADDER